MKIRFTTTWLFIAGVWAFMVGTRLGGVSSVSDVFDASHFRWVSWQGYYIAWFGITVQLIYSWTGWKGLSWSTTKGFRMWYTSVFAIVMIGGTLVVFPTVTWGPTQPGLIPGGHSSQEFLGIGGPEWIYFIETAFVHFFVPLAVVIEYFTWEDKTKPVKSTSWKFIPVLMAYPIMWLGMSIGLFFWDGWIPYTFMSFDLYGWVTWINYAAIIVATAIMPAIMIAVDRKRYPEVKLTK